MDQRQVIKDSLAQWFAARLDQIMWDTLHAQRELRTTNAVRAALAGHEMSKMFRTRRISKK